MSRFHEFMKECMRKKNLKGKDTETIKEEFRKCLEAWQKVASEYKEVVKEVDEEELARRYLRR